MKQTRKIMSPTFVTSGFVDEANHRHAVLLAYRRATSDRLDATSPSTATT